MYVPAPAPTLAVSLLLLLATCAAALPRAARGSPPSSPDATSPLPSAAYVLPFPGTPDASPQTQVDFGSVAPSQLISVSVTGSRSGTHTGLIESMPGGGGSAFLPTRPFAGGERVRVLARVKGIGGRSERSLGTSFETATPIALPPAAAGGPSVKTRQVHAALSPEAKTQSIHSEPWLHPPVLLTAGKVPDPGEGDFLADAEDSIQAGPLIYGPTGALIYFGGLHHAAAFNVEVQTYEGQSVLTYWQGYVSSEVGIGSDVVLNHSYQTVATVNAANGYHADLHEFQITPQGDALITAYAPVKADLRSVGGPRNGTLLDSIVQEINIATGQLLWEWHAYGHVQIAASLAGKPSSGAYDFFHINSVQQLANGNFVVSARNTSAVYEIDRATGRILWVLGGKHSSFRLGAGTRFWWQHDAELQPGNVLTVFDDGAGMGVTSERQSRGLEIKLNLKRHKATLVRAYTNLPSVLATSQGSVQGLPDGDTVVGFGEAQYVSEFDRRGRQRFSARFYAPITSYRDYRFPWYGQPTGSPYAAASATNSGTTVYASWDGATDVATWRVLAGSSPSALVPVSQAAFSGFETAIGTSSTQPYFAVQALSATGQLLGTSTTITR